MLDPSLMFHEGTEKCIALEKWDGYATRFVVPRFDLRPEDALMVFSASGRNNAPIEVALAGRERGLYTIGVTSRRYSDAFPSRHPTGKHLADVVDWSSTTMLRRATGCFRSRRCQSWGRQAPRPRRSP